MKCDYHLCVGGGYAKGDRSDCCVCYRPRPLSRDMPSLETTRFAASVGRGSSNDNER